MTALHHHISWSSQKQGTSSIAIKIDEKGRSGYRPSNSMKGYQLVTESFIITDVLKYISEVALQQLTFLRSGEKALINPLGFFYCNPTKRMTTALDQLKTEVENPRWLSEEKKKILRQIDLKEEQLKEAYPKIESSVRGFFTAKIAPEANQFIFHKDQKDREIDDWHKAMAVESFNYLYAQLGAQCCSKATLPQKTLNILGIKEASFLSCFEYTLAYVDPEVAKIFREKPTEAELDSFLVTQGWRNVTAPDEGDLVIYFNHISEKICHVGLYTERGTVMSKPGIANTNIFEHQPFDVLGIYGTTVYFMRRSPTVKF